MREMFGKQAWLFKNVPEIDESVIWKNLIYVVHARSKLQRLGQGFNLDERILLIAHDILFVPLGCFRSEFFFKHEGERVWDLVFAGTHFAHETGSHDHNGVNWFERNAFEGVFYKVLNVELQIEPDALENHVWRHSGMHGLSGNVVFRVNVHWAAVEHQSFLCFLAVAETNF